MTGYRPLFNFIGATTKISGSINLIDRAKIAPGESCVVQIKFNEGIISSEHFYDGCKFTFDEGGIVLGDGEIVKLL